MVQAFPSNRTDQPFHKRILPRTLGAVTTSSILKDWMRQQNLVAVDRVTITDQIVLAITFRKGFDNLLSRPLSGRMFGNFEGLVSVSSAKVIEICPAHQVK